MSVAKKKKNSKYQIKGLARETKNTLVMRGRPWPQLVESLWGCLSRALFAAGDFDTSFGDNGELTVDFPGQQISTVRDTTVQADGKILIVGECRTRRTGIPRPTSPWPGSTRTGRRTCRSHRTASRCCTRPGSRTRVRGHAPAGRKDHRFRRAERLRPRHRRPALRPIHRGPIQHRRHPGRHVRHGGLAQPNLSDDQNNIPIDEAREVAPSCRTGGSSPSASPR